MKDPHETLGLTPEANESEIRRRYLELVRAFPPDRAPERFAEIHAAYEALRDPARRLQAQLFRLETASDSFEALAEDLRRRLGEARLPVDTLLHLGDAL
jgi:curved DNA-binding protein CbpA